MPEAVTSISGRFTDEVVATYLTRIAGNDRLRPLTSFLDNPAFQLDVIETEAALRQLDSIDYDKAIAGITALREIYLEGNTFPDTVSQIKAGHQVTRKILQLATALYAQSPSVYDPQGTSPDRPPLPKNSGARARERILHDKLIDAGLLPLRRSFVNSTTAPHA